MDLSKKVKILENASDGKSEFEILEFEKLEGASSPLMAMGLKLNNSSIKTEAGALYYYKGNISSETKIGGVGGLFKKGISGAL
ncbi:AIM24 family protein, partial [Clostridioides difficile]